MPDDSEDKNVMFSSPEWLVLKLRRYPVVNDLSQYLVLLLNRDDFSLETECGTFIVRKDQLLVGNVHMAHRDSSIFDQPDTFMPSRFEDEVNTTQLLLCNTLELYVEKSAFRMFTLRRLQDH